MNKPHNWRIRSKLLLLIIFSALLSVILFLGLWHQQNNVCTLLERAGLVEWFDSEAFTEKARRLASDYTVPPFHESDEGMDDPTVVAFQPYCEALADEFTGVYVYGLDDGLYRASSAANIVTRSWFNTIWTLEFKMLGEEIYEIPVEFANGTYLVHVFSYHRILSTYPYLAFCLFVSIAFFLGSVLVFVNRMVRRIRLVERAILKMSGGDLEAEVPACGSDEIGTVASELDKLRITLITNQQREHEAQVANRDLITALSHDLRTPLTVLTGYLEILRRSDSPDKDRYAERCLQKAGDIRLLVDRIFDAALVEETSSPPLLQKLPLSIFYDALNDNLDFLRTCGFNTIAQLSTVDGDFFGDAVLIRRICDNLFSNIIKYGDKRLPIHATLQSEGEALHFTLQNNIKANPQTGSQIGLKNVHQMLIWLGGTLETEATNDTFSVMLSLPFQQQ